jgi:hypothetical protein
LKVKTPQPSLKRRYAPKEMRAQKGSYSLVSESPATMTMVREVVKVVGPGYLGDAETYERDNLLLDLLRQRDDLKE